MVLECFIFIACCLASVILLPFFLFLSIHHLDFASTALF